MQYRRLAVFLLCSMLAMAGCGGGSGGGNNDNTSDTGTTEVTTDPGTTNVTATITGPASSNAGRLSKAAIPSQAASVTLEVKTPDCSGTSVYNTKMDTAGQTSAAFNFTLTAGSAACFTAGAYSGAGGTGTLLYQGSTSGINLVAGESVNVEVSLSEVGAVKPTATTDAATSIGATSATLNATINPNGFETTAYFEWGLDTTYGNITPIQTTGAGTANVAISQAITGLTAGTTYHYRAVANNSGNTVYGSDQSLTTINTTESGVTVTFPATSAPTATTNAATSVTGTGATLNATVNPQGSATTAYFEWGTTTSYGNTTAWQEIGNGTTDVAVSAVLTGLTTGTTYHYRIVAYNAHGLTAGADGTVTAVIPGAGATSPVTSDATNVTDTSATLNGSFNNPSGYTTTVWFEYGTTTSYGSITTSQAYATAGNTAVSANLSGLNGQTTYHYRLVTQNLSGTFYGDDKTFTTLITPTTLASHLNYPSFGIAVDLTNVYWAELGSDTVKKVGINGETQTTLASGLTNPRYIAVDSMSVYWTEDSEVKKVGINGGTVIALASGLSSPYGIAVDSTSVYWAEASGIKKVSINGGTVTALASGSSSPYGGIAIDSTNVYWAEYDSGTVKKVDINGGTVTALASGLTYPRDIAVDSTSVYWTDNSGVKKVGMSGGTITTLASGSFYEIAVDSTSVYWTDYIGTGTVKKVGINGGTVTTLALGLKYPKGIAVDSTSVYWAEDYSSGTVKKIAK